MTQRRSTLAVRASMALLLGWSVSAGAACSGASQREAEAAATPEVRIGVPTPLADVPVGPGSAQPQLATRADRVILSWLEPGADDTSRLRFAELDGSHWTPATTIVEGPAFFVNWADVPSVVRLAGGRLAAHWLEKSGPGTYAYDVRLRHSDDGGATWSQPMTPHDDGTRTEHGFATLFDWPDGGLGLVWLDGREMVADEPGTHGDHGDMTLRATTIDAGGRRGPDMLLDARVCECCPTAAVRTTSAVIVAYRDRSDDEVRNIAVTRYVDGAWTPPRPVHDDNWRIPGCPVNGPALSASGRTVAIAWFTAEGDRPRVQVAFSADEGATFGPPVRVDDAGTLGRVDVELLSDGSAAVSWIEFAERRATLRVRRVRPDGTTTAPTIVAEVAGSRASGMPRMVRLDDRLYLAWTEVGTPPRVQMATIALLGERRPGSD